ncbi:unnamed protein product [Menidia menidia]|uniref:(Atlantic silverside) hypothetical protein n=1 Tax=Menidia menidia TaxID=238744 RepID=A0A8S4BH64_9TELE|nr:unnamed protein product [Menidia menidia]
MKKKVRSGEPSPGQPSADYVVGQVSGSLFKESKAAAAGSLSALFSSPSPAGSVLFQPAPKKPVLTSTQTEDGKKESSTVKGESNQKKGKKQHKQKSVADQKLENREISLQTADDEEQGQGASGNKRKRKASESAADLGAEHWVLKRQKQKANRKEDALKSNRTVFVGNLPISCTKKMLRSLFKEKGSIESIRFRSVVREDPSMSRKLAVIKRKIHPQRQNLNAYVVFKDEDGATKALERNGTEIEKDFHIRVDRVSDSSSALATGPGLGHRARLWPPGPGFGHQALALATRLWLWPPGPGFGHQALATRLWLWPPGSGYQAPALATRLWLPGFGFGHQASALATRLWLWPPGSGYQALATRPWVWPPGLGFGHQALALATRLWLWPPGFSLTAALVLQHDHKRSVFVGNLAFGEQNSEEPSPQFPVFPIFAQHFGHFVSAEMSELAFRKHFEECGAVEAVRLVRDQTSGLGKGFGYVLFKVNKANVEPETPIVRQQNNQKSPSRLQKADSVQLALELDGSKLEGRSVRVKRSVKKEKQKNKSDGREPRRKPGRAPPPGKGAGHKSGPGRGGFKPSKRFPGNPNRPAKSSTAFTGEMVDPTKKIKKKGLKKKGKAKKTVHI